MSPGGRAIGAFYGGYVWAVLLLIGPPTWCLLALLPGAAARWRLVRLAGGVLCRTTGIRLEVRGEPPDAGPFVVVANHESFIDAMVLIMTFRRPLAFLAGATLAGQAIAGPFLRRLGCEFVGEREPGEAGGTLARLETLLSDGRSIVIFPEGSLSPTPGLRRFHLGAFVLAVRTKCPILPVGLSGTSAVVPPGSRLPRRGRVTAAIGTPLEPGAEGRSAVRALREATRAALDQLTGAGQDQ